MGSASVSASGWADGEPHLSHEEDCSWACESARTRHQSKAEAETEMSSVVLAAGMAVVVTIEVAEVDLPGPRGAWL